MSVAVLVCPHPRARAHVFRFVVLGTLWKHVVC